MGKKGKQYSAEEKAKVALEALKGELTIAQISSKYGVHATQISKWKQEALESVVSRFKEKAKPKDTSQEQLIRELYEQIGQVTVERDWLKKKLSSLDVKSKKELLSSKDLELTLKRQCELLDLSRATYYYKSRSLSPEDYMVLSKIDEVFTEHPYYGTRRMMHALRVDGYKVGRKRLRRSYEILGYIAFIPKMTE